MLPFQWFVALEGLVMNASQFIHDSENAKRKERLLLCFKCCNKMCMYGPMFSLLVDESWQRVRAIKRECLLKIWLHAQSKFFKPQQMKSESSVLKVCPLCVVKVLWALPGWDVAKEHVSHFQVLDRMRCERRFTPPL